MTLYQLWMACVAVSLVLVAALLLIDRFSKLRVMRGWKVVEDCENSRRRYWESPDGVRFIVEDGRVIGWYKGGK